MKTKLLTFLLSLTFLLLFSDSVYDDDFQEGMGAYTKKKTTKKQPSGIVFPQNKDMY